MRSNRAWILGSLALATGVGVAYVVRARHPKLRPDSRILLIGDSLAVGLAPHLRALARDAELPFYAVAEPGSTISSFGGLARTAQSSDFAHALDSFAPTIVLVVLGTNDEIAGPDYVAREADDLSALYGRLEPYEVAWIGVPDLPGQPSGAADMIRDSGVPYFPTTRLELGRTADGVHFTASGYAAWAGAIWSWLT